MASIECSKDLDVSSFTQAEACHSISSPNSSSQELKCVIERDLLAADLRISLFVSAAQNFKYESLLKPIPEKFKRRDGEVDIDKLRSMISKFPLLPLDSAVCLDDQVYELLLNVLTPTSHQLNRISFHSLVKIIGGKLNFSCRPPNFCFEVDSPTRNQFWERKTAGLSTYYAFHGSRFENFYSILNLGLHQHLNKKSLFGNGIYLSTEQSLSEMYSTSGEGWSHSQIGPKLAILAVCEVIDHPEVKKGSSQQHTSNGVPEKYIVVPNNELVRVRYLLVYKISSTPNGQIASIWLRHKFLLLLGFYAALLLAIGMANKGYFK